MGLDHLPGPHGNRWEGVGGDLNPDWAANEEVRTRPDILVEMAPADLLDYVDACPKSTPGPDPGTGC